MEMMTALALATLGGGALYWFTKKPVVPTGTASAGVKGKSGTQWLATSEPMQGPAMNMSKVTIWAGPGTITPSQKDMVPVLQYAQVGTDITTRTRLAWPGSGLPDIKLPESDSMAKTTSVVNRAVSDFGVKS